LIKSNKIMLLTVALLCSALGLAGCGGSTTTTNSGNNAVVTNTNKASNTTAPANTTKTETTTTGDKIGVAECDEYIQKVEACIMSKVPEAQRGTYKTSFETMRKQWKDAAATPQGKSGLATGCKQALDAAKQTYGSYGCTF
jgi:hypothetical protein